MLFNLLQFSSIYWIHHKHKYILLFQKSQSALKSAEKHGIVKHCFEKLLELSEENEKMSQNELKELNMI